MTTDELNHILTSSNRTLKQLVEMSARDLFTLAGDLIGHGFWTMREYVAVQKIRAKHHLSTPKPEETVNVLDEAAKAFPNPPVDAPESLERGVSPENVQFDTIDKARAYIAKNADSKVRFVFEILSDRRPHHKRDINQAMRDNGWIDDNDCRKYVSQIRDYLALAASHYMIPDCPPGKPAIYQIILRK